MTVTIHRDIEQGTDEWRQLRCGLLTASEMKLIITPTLKIASNEKERTHLYELLSQRVNGYVDEGYQSFDMLRGKQDEIDARIYYSENYAPVEEVGFVTNDDFGFTLGCSPDGLVHSPKNGGIETKSRLPKYQAETILTGKVPDEYVIQVQSVMLVCKLDWLDFNSICMGMPMKTIRVEPDLKTQEAIKDAATAFEDRLMKALKDYGAALTDPNARLVPTTRRLPEQQMYV